MDKKTLLKDKRALGVIVARMQVPNLTHSHRSLLASCFNRHDRSVVFLGTGGGISADNPYPFLFRKQMIEAYLSLCANTDWSVSIMPLPDNPSDNKMWVFVLDSLIKAQIVEGEGAVLYGGRESFIPYYKKDAGSFETVQLAPQDYDSGTQLRLLSSVALPKYSAEAAQAIIWTINQLNAEHT